MKAFQLLTGLLLACNVAAIQSQSYYTQRLGKRQTSSLPIIKYPDVPSYNVSLPVDHFTSSDTRTFNNRYFVNDTYYKPGGPVIVYDCGESGASPSVVGGQLAEYNGTQSATMRLAERLNGLAIVWENRYFGYSQPFAVTIDESDPFGSNVPSGGPDDFKYHTVEQALEDLAFFANQFNTTTLSQNENVGSTANLDPYHSPWIIMGASYPGVRSAWARITHPEVFYAAWSSSAPVETRYDGSIWYNPVYRAMPQNCTDDIQAAVSYVDGLLQTGSSSDVLWAKSGVYVAYAYSQGQTVNIDLASSYEDFDVGHTMLSALQGDYQSYGAAHTLQYFCDAIVSFDIEGFMKSQAALSTSQTYWEGVIDFPAGSINTNGIAAASGNQAAFIAYQYAVYQMAVAESKFSKQYTASGVEDYNRNDLDANSWTWLTLTQMGFFQGSNVTSKTNLGSKYSNVTATHDSTIVNFLPTSFANAVPNKPDFTKPLSYGGWAMTPSNVMFTNGELDPWRAFGVQSAEQVDGGAPQRTTTQDVPACNVPPSGTDVFGLIYGGAVHGEDMGIQTYPQGSIDSTPPMNQGLDLFVKAWNTWLPCFNQSRDDIRNGKGVDGKGNNASGGKGSGSKNSASSVGGRFELLATVLGLFSLLFTFL